MSRDVPARISDLLRITPEQIEAGEFVLISKKENVVGKCYISEQTKELFRQLKASGLELPRTKRGIAKLLERACQIAGIPRLNQHLLRKTFRSTAINLGLNEIIIKILMMKSVPQETLTYYLDRKDLRDAWQKVTDVLSLEPRANGRVTNLQQAMDLVLRVLRKMIMKELQTEGYGEGMLGIIKGYSRFTYKEILEEYLKES